MPLGKLAGHGYGRLAAVEATGQFSNGRDFDQTLLVARGEGQDMLAVDVITRTFLGMGPSSISALGEYRDRRW